MLNKHEIIKIAANVIIPLTSVYFLFLAAQSTSVHNTIIYSTIAILIPCLLNDCLRE